MDNVLDRYDCVGSVGDDTARGDRDRLTGLEPAIRGPPGDGARNDVETTGRIPGADGVAIHCGARERRQVELRERGLRQHTSVRAVEPDRLDRKPLCMGENRAQGLGDRYELAHGRNATRVASRGTLAPVISVVVPVHDEEHSVEPLFAELTEALAPLGTPWEVVFVDDGSTDGTFARLTQLHDSSDNVRVVRLRRNFGKAAALAAGFAESEGEIVATIDGDLQDDPHEIPRLLAKLDEGFDLVSGWKSHRRDPLSRRILSVSSTPSQGECQAFGSTT